MLTTCKDCKREMSTSANKCPYCGAVPAIFQVWNVMLVIGGIIFLLFLFGFIH